MNEYSEKIEAIASKITAPSVCILIFFYIVTIYNFTCKISNIWLFSILIEHSLQQISKSSLSGNLHEALGPWQLLIENKLHTSIKKGPNPHMVG